MGADSGHDGAMTAARIALGGVLVVVGLLAGCATPTSTPGDAPGPGSSGAPPSATASGAGTSLPGVTLTRSGGLAGVNQTIVIGADGAWTYADRRSSATSSGQFTPAQVVQLAQLALDPRVAQEVLMSSGTVCNDTFHYTLSIGAQSATFEDCGQPRPAVQAMLNFIAENTAF
jgi:hypothetical protein